MRGSMDLIYRVLLETWKTLAEMAPYLLLGFAVAGILSVLVSPEKIEKHLGGRGFLPVLKAAIFGVPLPLCSCGVIPVAASLRRHGSSKGATLSFLLSTPQTGVDSIFVTYALLGPVFAVFRPIVAFITGLVGGSLMDIVQTEEEHKESPSSGAGKDACCSQEKKQSALLRIIDYGFVILPRDIAGPMAVGLVLAGLLGAVVPHDFFAGSLGTGFTAMLVMMLIGIPLYVCATASVPIAAALISAGVSPGAALVFLITGPATNTATIVTVWKVLGRKATAVYLGTIAITALAAGYTLDLLFTVSGIQAQDLACCNHTSAFGSASAVLLLGILGYGLLRPSAARGDSKQEDHEEVLQVTGMTCSHCAGSVKRALGECKGVESVDVDQKSGRVTVIGRDVSRLDLIKAVESLGFGAK
ncbi:MAG: hypothetical protein C0404_01640 [Verrucomicrobia bacterium]|nr:hypothetical protein [Verrucomicrobiota bacterium]